MYLIRYFFFFFFNDTATTEIYTLSLHDALPISFRRGTEPRVLALAAPTREAELVLGGFRRMSLRSEEHTSELQSRPHLVCRLLLEKKKKEDVNKKNILKKLRKDPMTNVILLCIE